MLTDHDPGPRRNALAHPGVLAALAAAGLFGAGTPLAKSLLGTVDPWFLAGLLYLGSGAGLSLWPAAQGRTRDAASRSAPLAGRGGACGRRHRAVAADVGAVAFACVSGVAAAQRRGRVHRVAGLVRVQGELRPPDRTRHGSNRRRGRRVELAGRSTDRRTLARSGRAGRLSGLGDRQQPHAQSGAQRRYVDCCVQGSGRGCGEPGARHCGWRNLAGGSLAGRCAGAGIRCIRHQPGAVRGGPSPPRHRAHRGPTSPSRPSSAPCCRCCGCASR